MITGRLDLAKLELILSTKRKLLLAETELACLVNKARVVDGLRFALPAT